MDAQTRDADLRRRLGIRHPIIQAPMAGGMTTPQLVAAVSEAGALGSVAGGMLAPGALREHIREVRARTQHPFSVNLFVLNDVAVEPGELQRAYERLASWREELGIAADGPPSTFAPDNNAQFAAALEERPPIVSFTFDALAPERMRALHDAGIFTIGTATTIEEAQLLVRNGVDAIVAQGSEAGGHRGTFIGDALDALLPVRTLVSQFVSALDVPIIAAGGIMSGSEIAALLSAGASAVQMGTAFLGCPEAGTHPLHLAALRDRNTKTIVTNVASGKYARGIHNRLFADADPSVAIPPYPVQNALTMPIRAAAAKLSRADLMVMLSGEHHHAVRTLPASELVRTLVDETQLHLNP